MILNPVDQSINNGSPLYVGVNACALGAQAFTPTLLSVERLDDLYFAIP